MEFYSSAPRARSEVARGQLKTTPAGLKDVKLGPNDVHLYESRSHYQNWLDCIRTRGQTICPAEIGCRSVTVCHLWQHRTLAQSPDPLGSGAGGDHRR